MLEIDIILITSGYINNIMCGGYRNHSVTEIVT